jgi:uncharacterized membrane-anchored protein YjiN (DUF445 family)
MTIDSADEFVRLRESTNPAEYHRAGHEEATLEVWRDVIERYPDMRKWVAYNKTVPLEILATLASDPDWYVRSTVAMKRKLTPDLLEQLAADESESIRMQVARHRHTARSTLERLRDDPWDQIREEVRKRLETLDVWREVIERHPEARKWDYDKWDYNKTVPREILSALASDPDPRVRHLVTMKRKVASALLDQLAADEDQTIRMQVALHRNTARSTLEKLRDDPWDRIRELVRNRLDQAE